MPITIDTPLSAAILACATVAAGTVKSITTLAAPMAVAASDTIFTPLAPTPATSPASRPSALLPAPSMAPARLQPSVCGDLPDQHLAHAPGGAGYGDLHVVPLRLDRARLLRLAGGRTCSSW